MHSHSMPSVSVCGPYSTQPLVQKDNHDWMPMLCSIQQFYNHSSLFRLDSETQRNDLSGNEKKQE